MFEWLFKKQNIDNNRYVASAVELASGVTFGMPKAERLERLKMFFLRVLVEDPLDGTLFDCDVLNAIETLETKYKKQ